MPLAEIFYFTRNMAIKKGYMPDIYSEFAHALMNDARIVNVSRFAKKKRTNLGLPPLQPTGIRALKKILSATGFDKLHKKNPSTK